MNSKRDTAEKLVSEQVNALLEKIHEMKELLPAGMKITELKVERAPGDVYICKESSGGVLVCKQL